MSRLLNSFAAQTVQPNQVILVVNANYVREDDNLLFHSTDATVNRLNGFGIHSPPSQRQVDYWNTFLQQIGAKSQAACLSSFNDIEYYWAGYDPKLKVPSGPSANRLRALAHAKNDWITYFDDDDFMHQRRVEFLNNAINHDVKDLDAIYHSTSMFKLDNDTSAAKLLSWWFDPFVIFTDKHDIPPEYADLPQKIEDHFTRDYTIRLPPELQNRIAAAQKLPIIDHPHISWQDVLRESMFPEVAHACAPVVNGGALNNTDYDVAIREGDTLKHASVREWGAYLDTRYRNHLVWRSNVTNSHIPGLSETGIAQIHAGWITIKKDIFNMIKPSDKLHDDNTYQFWRMHHVCRKTRFNYNVLGLYLKPYMWEY